MKHSDRTTPIRRRPPFIMLFVAITLLSASIWDLSIVWTSKSDLIALKGTFEVSRTQNIRTSETYRRGGGYTYTAVEIRFRLKEHDRLFILTESAGEKNSQSPAGDIIQELQQANEISVWIRKDEESLREPNVFQIDTDKHNNLVSLNSRRFKASPFAGLMLLMGIAFLLVFFAATYPEKIFRLLRGRL